MSRFFLLVMVLFTAVAAQGASSAGRMMRLKDGIARYVEYEPAKKGMPTIVMINGLVYGTERWEPFRGPLRAKGYGLVNYDFRGQRFTLRQEVIEKKTPLFFKDGLESKQLVAELNEILTTLRVRPPLVVVGLSYGAHTAALFALENAPFVHRLILMAPIIVPLDRYNPGGQWVIANLDWLRMVWGPIWGPIFYEKAYGSIYRSYYKQNILPERVPEELKDMPGQYRESIFQLTRVTRDFDMQKLDFSKLTGGRVHLLTAGQEDANALPDQWATFEKIAPVARGTLIHFPAAAHALPDTAGEALPRLVDAIIRGDAQLRPGQKYQMTPTGPTQWNAGHVPPNTTR